MTIEQRHQKGGARFRLARDKARALFKGQLGSHNRDYNSSAEITPAAG